MICHSSDSLGFSRFLNSTVMNEINKGFKNTVVQVIIRNSCKVCDRVLNQTKSISQKFPLIKIQVFNVDKEQTIPNHCQSFITPAVWVNGKLWFLGGFDYDRFCEKLMLLENPVFKSGPTNISIN